MFEHINHIVLNISWLVFVIFFSISILMLAIGGSEGLSKWRPNARNRTKS